MLTMPTNGLRIAGLIERLGRVARGLRYAEGLKPTQWEALRYIAAANTASRNPGALAAFLGSTRGTVSQTLISLEGKGLVTRTRNAEDGRGTDLDLTRDGLEMLQRDPLLEFEAAALALENQEALAFGLTELLRQLQKRNGFNAFGECQTCRNFRPGDLPDDPNGPHRCGLTNGPISESESQKICRENRPRAS